MTEEEIAKITTEVIKQISKEAYGDALKPGMQQIGKALGTVIGLGNTILLPLELLNEKSRVIKETILRQWHEKMKEIPEAKIIEADPEIAVPILSKLTYTTNEQLVDLFLNLLTSASNEDKVNLVHPSFIHTISNLSSDEAKILNYMYQDDQPFCTMHIRAYYHDVTHSDHFHNTSIFDCNDLIKFKNNTKVYLDNLISLGIIKKWNIPTEVEQFKYIEEFLEPNKQVLESSLKNLKNVVYLKAYYDLTDYGKQFLEVSIIK
ncbi:MAG: DUF4393 domain-containing protein [Saprospiraceae bacterium]|nr:DUF4393 domain-containing protein [Saprospiraceae bacterium]